MKEKLEGVWILPLMSPSNLLNITCLLQSNVRKTQRRMPDSPCEVCKGSGRVDCHHCQGRGSSFSLSIMCPYMRLIWRIWITLVF